MPSRNVLLLVGGAVGADLAPARGIATLPVTAALVGAAEFTAPTALIVRRLGRRNPAAADPLHLDRRSHSYSASAARSGDAGLRNESRISQGGRRHDNRPGRAPIV
jgi:hypothetical protein